MKKLNLITLYIFLLPYIVYGQNEEYDTKNREPIYFIPQNTINKSFYNILGFSYSVLNEEYDLFLPLDSTAKNLKNIKRLILYDFTDCKGKINFSLYPNLEELIFSNGCCALDSIQIKYLEKLKILRIFHRDDFSPCSVDWPSLNREFSQEDLLFNTNQDIIFPHLKELTIYSKGRKDLKYINESFWLNKSLKRVYSTGSFFYPLGYLLRFDIKKAENIPYNVYDTTELSFIDGGGQDLSEFFSE